MATRLKADNYAERCRNHRECVPDYICSGCSALLCKECAKPVGSFTARVCSACGSLCLGFTEHQQRQRLIAEQREPFGCSDLSAALVYPLKDFAHTAIVGLILGAGFFSLPFFNAGAPGLLLGAVGLLPALITTSLMLGCINQLIGRVESGQPSDRHVYDIVALLADALDTLAKGAAVLLTVSWPYVLSVALRLSGAVPRWAGLAWAVVVYPTTLMVAFRTDRFWTTINPVAGVAAAVEIGRRYLKFFAYYLLIVAGSGIPVYLIARSVLDAAFSFPSYLLVGLVVGPPIFYANVAIGFLVGRLLFKSPPESQLM